MADREAPASPPPVLLFDVFSLLYRAFFALPPMNTAAGAPTSALYGFSTVILKMLREERAAGAAFAIDRGTQTFRRAAFAGYKASRPAAPSDLSLQVGKVPELLQAFGFPCFSVEGYEADDVLATLSRELRQAGPAPLVVTGDLDLLQCALGTGRVHALGRGTQGQTYDQAAVLDRYGVLPGALPEWKALAGDVTDEIPGLPGVGARTATRLVQQFGSVAALLDRLPEVRPPALRATIEQHREQLPLWRQLTQLHDDVPLPAGPRWQPFTAEARQRTAALFQQLEFRSLLPRLAALAAPAPPPPATRQLNLID